MESHACGYISGVNLYKQTRKNGDVEIYVDTTLTIGLRMFVSAPASRRSFTIAVWPLQEAMISAVWPSYNERRNFRAYKSVHKYKETEKKVQCNSEGAGLIV
jgi:hypothetical protein